MGERFGNGGGPVMPVAPVYVCNPTHADMKNAR
jgi:hypothetical protein